MTVDSIEIKQWYAPGGGMMYNTYGLEPDHFMHPYNQALSQGVRPEDFGIEHPLSERFKEYSRTQLIEKITQLEKEVEGWAKADAGGWPK